MSDQIEPEVDEIIEPEVIIAPEVIIEEEVIIDEEPIEIIEPEEIQVEETEEEPIIEPEEPKSEEKEHTDNRSEIATIAPGTQSELEDKTDLAQDNHGQGKQEATDPNSEDEPENIEEPKLKEETEVLMPAKTKRVKVGRYWVDVEV